MGLKDVDDIIAESEKADEVVVEKEVVAEPAHEEVKDVEIELKEVKKEALPEEKEVANKDANALPDVKVAEYVPNFKYKAGEKEYEVDEFLKPLIKDAETEEKVKKILEKANGLELNNMVKEKWKKKAIDTEQRYNEAEERFNTYHNAFGKSAELYAQGNKAEAVLAVFPPEDIEEAMNLIQQYQQSDAFTKKRIENSLKATYDNVDLAQKNKKYDEEINSYKEKESQQIAQAVDHEFNEAVNLDDETRTMAQWYDKHMGEGSFKNYLYNTGEKMYDSIENPIQPRQVVEIVKNKFREMYPQFKNVQTAQANKPSQIGQNFQVKTPSQTGDIKDKKMDRIPSMNSKGTVVKKKWESPEDIDNMQD